MKTNATGSMELEVCDRRKKNSDGEQVVLHEERKEWLLESRTFDPNKPPIEVSLTLGMTKNLGQYQFARMDLGVKVFCPAEELEETYERAKKWISTKIEREVKTIDKSFVEEGRLK